jgi:4-amino-4-deoxy-L-arabinose transferase-like glycosyltransferase
MFLPSFVPPAFTACCGAFTVADSARALLVCGGLSICVVAMLLQIKEDRVFLVRLFIAALLIRMLVAGLVFGSNTQVFFGGDAYTYDTLGVSLIKSWEGSMYDGWLVQRFTGAGLTSSGWGMVYLVGTVYSVIGRNMFAVQLVNAVAGALTAPIVFLIALRLFGHRNLARTASIAVAFFPSLVLWSAQGLKDGPIMFLLALTMLATLKLGEKFDIVFFLILVGSLFGLLSMRFYVFYIAAAAVGMAFILGTRAMSTQSVVRQFVILLLLGGAFSYLGISKVANAQIETYGSLEYIEQVRSDLSRSADSGYGKDLNVSTTSGALTAIPIGTAYVLFAPFPWQMGSMRSLITLPEMAVWWSCFPLLVLGVWYALRYKTRKSAPILVFVSMLTVAYAVFQGNVGTAYRQRSQLLVFYLIFVAVGFHLYKEIRENRKVRK